MHVQWHSTIMLIVCFVLVTKKKIGNATKRNRIKRILRDILHNATKNLNIIKLNYSYLLIAKNSVLKGEYNNIKETLFNDFERIR